MIKTIIEIVGGTAALAVLATDWVVTGFFMVAGAKPELPDWKHVPIGVKAVIYKRLWQGYIGDFLYNTVVGTIRFRELPRWWPRKELMYSARVQRHVDSWRYANLGIAMDGTQAYTTSQHQAYAWATLLNAAWPDHIHLGPVS